MTPTPTNTPTAPSHTPRLHLLPDPSGYIDATWWPRSGDLTAELPDLITALQLRTGPIWRVVYDPRAWTPPADRQITMDDRAIRLDPYAFELFGTMYMCAANGAVTVLQVIPSGAESDPPHIAVASADASARSGPALKNAPHDSRPITNHSAMGIPTGS